jgi:hypothetical protein
VGQDKVKVRVTIDRQLAGTGYLPGSEGTGQPTATSVKRYSSNNSRIIIIICFSTEDPSHAALKKTCCVLLVFIIALVVANLRINVFRVPII